MSGRKPWLPQQFSQELSRSCCCCHSRNPDLCICFIGSFVGRYLALTCCIVHSFLGVDLDVQVCFFTIAESQRTGLIGPYEQDSNLRSL